MPESEPLSVSQFNEVINVQLQNIGLVSVVGEITEKHISRNSGLMMTIKDEKQAAILKLSGFAPRVKGVNMVEVGMKIVAVGVPQIYAPFGSFSLQVVSLEPYGEGSLKIAFEKLKQLLEAKGYFAPERKRFLPEFVTRIALVTAEGSAAQTDFLKILGETKTGLDIDFYPVSVQGKNAVDEVVNSLNSIKSGQVDCIVLTRGGGSLEDLIAFNSEEVANAVFAAKAPVISAVGHERDTSISDMVADIVASTPSQAAYYLAAHNDEFLKSIQEKISEFDSRISRLLEKFDYNYTLKFMSQKIDESIKSLDYTYALKSMNYKIVSMIATLDYSDKLSMMNFRIDQKLEQSKSLLIYSQKLLRSLNPKEVLNRGYALLRMNQQIIKSAKDIKIQDNLEIQLTDGKIDSIVKNIKLD